MLTMLERFGAQADGLLGGIILERGGLTRPGKNQGEEATQGSILLPIVGHHHRGGNLG